MTLNEIYEKVGSFPFEASINEGDSYITFIKRSPLTDGSGYKYLSNLLKNDWRNDTFTGWTMKEVAPMVALPECELYKYLKKCQTSST